MQVMLCSSHPGSAGTPLSCVGWNACVEVEQVTCAVASRSRSASNTWKVGRVSDGGRQSGCP